MNERCVILIVLAMSCAKGPTKPAATGASLSFNGTVRNVLSPAFDPVTTTSFGGFCDGPPVAQIQLVDIAPLLSGTFTPLATCESDPATGTFSCHGDTLGTAGQLIVAFVTSAPGASDCIAPTLAVVALCQPNCATVSLNQNGVIKEGDANTAPILVLPSKTVTHINTQLATEPSATEFGDLTKSGAILSIFADASRKPTAGVKPWSPLGCGADGLSCKSWILAPDDTFGAAIDTAATLTSANGMVLTQAQVTTNGQIKGASPNLSGDPTQGYGGIGCVGGTPGACFTPVSSGITRQGVVPNVASSFITLDFIMQSEPVNGSCGLLTQLQSLGKASLYSCQ